MISENLDKSVKLLQLASGCWGAEWDTATPLLSAERPHDVQVLGDTSAKDGGSRRIMAGYGRLACNGNGCLVMTEHEGGIEQVVGFRLGSGHG